MKMRMRRPLAPLGRRVSGLKEKTTRRSEFKKLVSYRTYRLADTTRVVDSEDTGRVNGYLKKLKSWTTKFPEIRQLKS